VPHHLSVLTNSRCRRGRGGTHLHADCGPVARPWHAGPTAAREADCAVFASQVWAQSVDETDLARDPALAPEGNGLGCADLPVGAAPAWWTSEILAGAALISLASIVDGDTIRVLRNDIEEPVRLILIDTPETHDPNDLPECSGSAASSYLR
jgi:hypothetical protein